MSKSQRSIRYLSMFLLACLAGLVSIGNALGAVPTPVIVGTLKVERHGDHGRPVILIPGLGSGAWVWTRTVAGLEKNHEVYVVTLAGFDGTPSPKGGNYLDQAEASLLRLVAEKHLHRPVLVGHSLGGTLALKLAAEKPQLFAGVVAVDGLPVFPGTENLPKAQRPAMAAAMQAKMASATPPQFLAQQVDYMQTIGVLDPRQARRYGQFSAKSDPGAVAQYMAEDFSLDFRDELARATIPLLEISPYNPPDFAGGPMAMSEQQKTGYYRSLLAHAPKVAVVSISPSRHFVMLDQPVKFQQTLDDFLASL